ncbi:MAG: hypothetical protein IT173_16255 [Acidobacteria bacterium]|nr:hypothetical protein [Acidobacteriota bacterium]
MKVIAEYSGEVAQEPRVSYLTTDHLGSPRVTTNERGVVVNRRDFMPFGEEINGVGGRTTGLNYGSDSVRQKFTGYERDNESALDFAQARYYNSSHGRFTSVDPYTPSQKVSNPQSLNRYSYVLNDPLNSVDPSGLMSCPECCPECWLDENKVLHVGPITTEICDKAPAPCKNTSNEKPATRPAESPPRIGLLAPAPAPVSTTVPSPGSPLAPTTTIPVAIRTAASVAGKAALTYCLLPLAAICLLPSTANPYQECGTKCSWEKEKADEATTTVTPTTATDEPTKPPLDAIIVRG